MREILFRGKRVDNGKWVYGYYAHLKNMHDVKADIIYTGYADMYMGSILPEYYEVNPETVGQYTGLKDLHGTRIFEGDIVRTKKYGRIIELNDHTYTNVRDYDTFVVCYSPCMFRLLREKPDRGFNLVNDGYAQLEVVGNVHDGGAYD